MQKYRDTESGEILEESTLLQEFSELKRSDPASYFMTFREYLLNCMDKNGFLSKVEGLCVCENCLAAIESHEGVQAYLRHYVDDDSELVCDWCEEPISNVLYELI